MPVSLLYPQGNYQNRSYAPLIGKISPDCDINTNALPMPTKTIDFSSRITRAVNTADGLHIRNTLEKIAPQPNHILLSRENNQQELARMAPVKQYNLVTLPLLDQISIPAEMLIVDVLNPLSKDPTNAWFEELIWHPQNNTFETTPKVYCAKMQVLAGAHPEWKDYTGVKTAFAIFLDGTDSRPRIFINTKCQHIGIKPNMGNPVYAGLIEPRRDNLGRLFFHIDNNSGHYQPADNIDVKSIFKNIVTNEGLYHLKFSSVDQLRAPDNARLAHISSIEDYAILADSLRHSGNKEQRLIDYLVKHDLWTPLKDHRSNQPWVKTLMKWEDNQNADHNAVENTSKISEKTTSPALSPRFWQRLTNWVSNTSGYLIKLLSCRNNVTDMS
ncbi:Uncharacterised protein [Serratia fonticola]|uniref:Uncharacterized protein n=2 Tax=Serratia fonticola TaxID=47917 RepID=A0A4U9WK16_SERFO|nr:Uncharacterised protein [Serratia fonticola]VTR59372.1 Uncharacterised protein [Serratia fonticola]